MSNKFGISYNAGYLKQGNLIDKCSLSNDLKVSDIELFIRTDGKDSNIKSIIKKFKGNIIFNVPSINPDLSNMKIVNELVRTLKNEKIDIITVNASNLSMELFEWSTLDEQKTYISNIVNSLASIISNKIVVAIENTSETTDDLYFGNSIKQLTDIIVNLKKVLVNKYYFNEKEIEKYMKISINLNNIKDNKQRWLEMFNEYTKIIKFSDVEDLKFIEQYDEDKIILYQTDSELENIEYEYNELTFAQEIEYNLFDNNKKISDIIILIMVILTIIIVFMMFIVKLS